MAFSLIRQGDVEWKKSIVNSLFGQPGCLWQEYSCGQSRAVTRRNAPYVFRLFAGVTLLVDVTAVVVVPSGVLLGLVGSIPAACIA